MEHPKLCAKNAVADGTTQTPFMAIIKPSVSVQACLSTESKSCGTNCRTTKEPACQESNIKRADHTSSTSVYISSSMFSKLDSSKLSSKSQTAHVFSYPGPTVTNLNDQFNSILTNSNSETLRSDFLITNVIK
jgi:hypothetical protein